MKKEWIQLLVFGDISISKDHHCNKNIRLVKKIVLACIVLVSVGGIAFTIRHTYMYYVAIRDDYLHDDGLHQSVYTNDGNRKEAVFYSGEAGDPTRIQGILAFFENYQDQTLSIVITNINDIPVELIQIESGTSSRYFPFKEKSLLQPDPSYPYTTYTFPDIPQQFIDGLQNMVVTYKYENGTVKQASIYPFRRIDNEIFTHTAVRETDTLSNFDFLMDDGETIFFDRDVVVIDQPLIIPADRKLVVSADQEIDLINQAFILSRSPIFFEGLANHPVRIFSSDASGGGVLVSQANQPSKLSYVIFDGLNTPRSGFWELTGAVNFYESDVSIDHGQFINNTDEDGLNIIRSQFEITDSYFRNTFSDAFDADFCTGTISNALFENTGNDAVDFSNSQIEVADTVMRKIGDKAISGGENSSLTISNIEITGATIGIASKDLSHIEGNKVSITDCMIGLTLYQKKSEFGPATIDMKDLTAYSSIDMPYLIQQKSQLIVDGEIILPRSSTKEGLLFDKMISGEPIQ